MSSILTVQNVQYSQHTENKLAVRDTSCLAELFTCSLPSILVCSTNVGLDLLLVFVFELWETCKLNYTLPLLWFVLLSLKVGGFLLKLLLKPVKENFIILNYYIQILSYLDKNIELSPYTSNFS